MAAGTVVSCVRNMDGRSRDGMERLIMASGCLFCAGITPKRVPRTLPYPGSFPVTETRKSTTTYYLTLPRKEPNSAEAVVFRGSPLSNDHSPRTRP